MSFFEKQAVIYKDGDGERLRGTQVEHVIISEGLRELPDFAFESCHNLLTCVFPSSLERFGVGCFKSCSKLESLNICHTNTHLIESFAFQGCHALAVVRFPKELRHLHQYAFAGCQGLPAINIPPGVRLSPFTFFGCSSLQSIEFPDELVAMPHDVFNGCSSLVTVHIPGISLREIGANAFANCTGLRHVVIAEVRTQ